MELAVASPVPLGFSLEFGGIAAGCLYIKNRRINYSYRTRFSSHTLTAPQTLARTTATTHGRLLQLGFLGASEPVELLLLALRGGRNLHVDHTDPRRRQRLAQRCLELRWRAHRKAPTQFSSPPQQLSPPPPLGVRRWPTAPRSHVPTAECFRQQFIFGARQQGIDGDLLRLQSLQ